MKSQKATPESRIKAAVIDRLLSSGRCTDNSVLITELPIANYTRRADVVLANGSLWAFEIKSERDSLIRLDGQISDLRRYFEFLVVVVAERFVDRVLSMVPPNVGVWVAGPGNSLKEKVRPRKELIAPEAAVALMTVSELRRLLECNGVQKTRLMKRPRLEELCLQLSQRDLATAARHAIKQRFHKGYGKFLKRREKSGALAAMTCLQRGLRASKDKTIMVSEPALELGKSVDISDNHPLRVETPVGPILKRLVRR